MSTVFEQELIMNKIFQSLAYNEGIRYENISVIYKILTQNNINHDLFWQMTVQGITHGRNKDVDLPTLLLFN